MQVIGSETGDLQALDGSGVVYPVGADGYVTLGVDDYYFIVGGMKGATVESVQILTDATIAGVFTIEVSNLPRDPIQGSGTISDYNETSSTWVLVNPSTAYIPTVGTGWSVSSATMTKTAGVGAAIVDLIASGAKRLRIKAAITTGGKVRVTANGKD